MQSTSCENQTIATLHLNRPGQPRTTQVIRENECLAVGSDPGSDICLCDDEAASTHCMISARGGFVTVRDCFSETGTFVDKTRIRETQLMTDAEIRIGKASISVKLNNHIAPQRNEMEFDTPILELAATFDADASASAGKVARNESAEDRNSESVFRKIGDLESQLEQAHAEIEVLRNRLNTGPKAIAQSTDPYQDEMLELLRAEVLDLQAALADREQIATEDLSADEAVSCSDDVLSKPDAEKLVDRLEQLLQELQQRDDQIATLTELLEAAEAANRAELEERTQIDSWLRDIEQRCGDREHEWRSQQTRLQSELEAIAAERDLAETALNAESSSVKLEAAQNVMTGLRETAELQRRKLHDAEQTIDQLQRQLDSTKNAAPREEQMQLAEERAEIARLRQEVEVERLKRQNPAADDNNLKLRALRQHLNEIHEHEQKEREERRLSSRIARLWHRLDGR